jgi:hypothetical protein
MAIYTGKIRGLTAASATVATVDVTYDADGFLSFTDTESNKHRIAVEGAVAELVKMLFTGTDGLEAGTTDVQGHRVFNVPKLKQ